MVGVPGSNPGVSTNFLEVKMLEFNIFNSAQIFDQIFAFICVYLLTSLNAKTRLYGFIVGTVGFIPGVYLLIVTELWWLLAFMPIWAYINYIGIVNNYKEYKKTKVA